jgi:hypothetical protein
VSSGDFSKEAEGPSIEARIAARDLIAADMSACEWWGGR